LPRIRRSTGPSTHFGTQFPSEAEKKRVPARQESTLTPREREVAALVADGLTNRQIAGRLFISERTAEHHVEQIRSKLGFHSRAQVAAWVAGSTVPLAPAPAAAAALPVDASSSRQSATSGKAHRRRWVIALPVAMLVAVGLAAFAFSATRQGGSALTIVTMAGTGRSTFSADGRPARATDLIRPAAVVVDPNGTLYFIDGNRVRMITGRDTIKTIAGTGDSGYGGDDGPALSAQLNSPKALAIDPDGDVFIADTGNNRVREVDPKGKIFTVAGTGDAGYSGDGERAVRARLNAPTGLAVGFGSSLFIADTLNHRVRMVTSEGVISTVAGTGTAAYTFEGGPATAAPLNLPEALAFDSEGNLYIEDVGNDRVRKVLGGEIVTVAGTGVPGSSGDGQPASAAELSLVSQGLGSGQALAVDSQGNLYIADAGNEKIREVDFRGTISSVAGTGRAGYSADGSAPLQAMLNDPLSVAVDAQGVVYIADSENNLIREIAPRR
jgi:DNA-binding CsgD family transcriptional regulator/sugar lactone lactonase YvrE